MKQVLQLKLIVLTGVLLLTSCASTMKPYQPGVQIPPGHGVLMLMSDTKSNRSFFELMRLSDGSKEMYNTPTFGKGIDIKMVVLPAGDYRFKSFSAFNLRYDFGDIGALPFTVKADAINYLGTFTFRFYGTVNTSGLSRSSASGGLRLVDRSDYVLSYLDKNNPELLQQYGFNATFRQ